MEFDWMNVLGITVGVATGTLLAAAVANKWMA
jgi:hypothetical protein